PIIASALCKHAVAGVGVGTGVFGVAVRVGVFVALGVGVGVQMGWPLRRLETVPALAGSATKTRTDPLVGRVEKSFCIAEMPDTVTSYPWLALVTPVAEFFTLYAVSALLPLR